MEWIDILTTLLQTLCYAVCVLVIPLVVKLFRVRTNNGIAKDLIDSAENIVIKSVRMLNQIFVDALKGSKSWDDAAMTEAFTECRKNILALLNDETKLAILKLHGDLDAWIKTMIEAHVGTEKLGNTKDK